MSEPTSLSEPTLRLPLWFSFACHEAYPFVISQTAPNHQPAAAMAKEIIMMFLGMPSPVQSASPTIISPHWGSVCFIDDKTVSPGPCQRSPYELVAELGLTSPGVPIH